MLSLLKASIYLLCLLTAAACSLLLWRGYRRSGFRLLLWSAVCFGFLALHSVVVMVELTFFPGTDLQMLRHVMSGLAVGALILGLVWEAE